MVTHQGTPLAPIKQARLPGMHLYTALIVVIAFSIAIRLGLDLSRLIEFSQHNQSGIVGWISWNHYPKQQEFYFFLGSLIGLPLFIIFFWLTWVFISSLVANQQREKLERVLKHHAVALSPLLLCWYKIHQGKDSLDVALGLPLVLSFTAAIISAYFRQKKPHTITEDSAELEETPPDPDSQREPPQALSPVLSLGKYFLIPLTIYAFTYSSDINGRIDFFHEGERLAPLNEYLRGGLPYKDVYIQQGLFKNYYLSVLADYVYGPTLEGVRRTARLIEPLAYVALYLLGTQVFRFSVISSLLLVVIASAENFWVAPRQGMGLLAVALMLSGMGLAGKQKSAHPLSNSHLLKLTGAGLISALAFWYSVEIGLYTIGALTLFLVLSSCRSDPRDRLRPMVSYLGGVLLGFFLVGAYLISQDIFVDALRNTYYQCAYQLSIWGLAFPPVDRLLQMYAQRGAAAWQDILQAPEFRMYLTPFVFLLTATFLVYRMLCGTFRSTRSCPVLLLLLLSGAAFFRTALGRSDVGHWIDGSTYLWVLCLFPADWVLGEMRDSLTCKQLAWKSRALRLAKQGWIIIPAAALTVYITQVHHPGTVLLKRWDLLFSSHSQAPAKTEPITRAGNIIIPKDQAEQIKEVVSLIRSHTTANEPIFDFSNNGAYYFFSNRPAVTRYYQIVYASTPRLQQEVVNALKSRKPRLVIYRTGSVYDAIDGVPNEKRHPLVFRYLKAHYLPEADIRGTQILLRK